MPIPALLGLYEWTCSEPLQRTTDWGIPERPLASIDRLHFMLRFRPLIGTPKALSSGKVKRGFGGIFGRWIGEVLTVINILNLWHRN